MIVFLHFTISDVRLKLVSTFMFLLIQYKKALSTFTGLHIIPIVQSLEIEQEEARIITSKKHQSNHRGEI